MKRVLILTKCIDYERDLEKKLLELGHEVFISSKLVDSFLQQTSQLKITDFFETIVLSDTLTNHEVILLLKVLGIKQLRILRKAELEPTEDDRQFWISRGLTDWLVMTSLLEKIRELLNATYDLSIGRLSYKMSEDCEKISLNSLSLNATQKKILTLLYEKKGEVISRNDMCRLLWERSATASNLSQLSAIIKSLKKKLLEQGIRGESIVTVWGDGYHLSGDFFEQVTINELRSGVRMI
ncbi:winged helix-turn-helix domain-containing protein [Enterococcus sp. DIV0187]|uniref:winged helix-turn-helix domain-containing protein n=1 Tax=Enterococcus sp. DIV0187 TaxID=2774644 RepID=UPI003F2706F1